MRLIYIFHCLFIFDPCHTDSNWIWYFGKRNTQKTDQPIEYGIRKLNWKYFSSYSQLLYTLAQRWYCRRFVVVIFWKHLHKHKCKIKIKPPSIVRTVHCQRTGPRISIIFFRVYEIFRLKNLDVVRDDERLIVMVMFLVNCYNLHVAESIELLLRCENQNWLKSIEMILTFHYPTNQRYHVVGAFRCQLKMDDRKLMREIKTTL